MNKQVARLSFLGSLFLGFFFFLVYHRVLTIHWHRYIPIETNKPFNKLACVIHYFTQDEWHQETRTIIQDPQHNNTFEAIVKAWSAVISEEVLHKTVTLEFCTLNTDQSELFISFNRSPFLKKWSSLQRLKLLESLTKTLEPCKQSLKKIRLFVNHKILKDDHLDLSSGWNLEMHSIPLPQNVIQKYPIKRIIIEPFGGKLREGRKIGTSSERIITLKLAYQIKKELESTTPYSVLILRDEFNSEFERLLKISKAQPDLYLNLGAYQESDDVHHAVLAYYTNGVQTENSAKPKDFILYDSIMTYFYKESAYTIFSLKNAASSHALNSHVITSVVAAPFLPLKGIASPAVMIEIGVSALQEERNLNIFIQDIIKQAIKTIALP